MHSFLTRPASAFGKPVCRLGLSSRGPCEITPDDVLEAVGQGINFLNWPGESETSPGVDAFSQAIAELDPRRDSVVVSLQLAARTAEEAGRELRSVLATLRTDYVDVVTMYYVQRRTEWEALCARQGALTYCRAARRDGVIRRLGISSHQRPLAAEAARSGLLDVLMLRYNAAHRGAESEVFPTTDALKMPVIAYTALRWGALLAPTPDDPPGFVVPLAESWYRFVLQSDSVAVALAAPKNRAELLADLALLRTADPLEPSEYERLATHGKRVRVHGGAFT